MKRSTLRTISTVLAATLAGGTLFGTCEMRVRDAVVNGTELFFLQLFDPGNVTIGGAADSTNGNPSN